MSASIQISVEDFKALQDKELVELPSISYITMMFREESLAVYAQLGLISFDGEIVQFESPKSNTKDIIDVLVDNGVCFTYIS